MVENCPCQCLIWLIKADFEISCVHVCSVQMYVNVGFLSKRVRVKILFLTLSNKYAQHHDFAVDGEEGTCFEFVIFTVAGNARFSAAFPLVRL